MNDTEIFQNPQFFHTFKPVPGGMVIKIDEVAFKAVVDNWKGRRNKTDRVYVMLTYEGGLDPNWPFEHSWGSARRRAMEAPLLIYNTAKKTVIRPVWTQPLDQRTRNNAVFERVNVNYPNKWKDRAKLPKNAVLFTGDK